MNLIDKLSRRFKASLGGQIVSIVSGAILIVVLTNWLKPSDYGHLFLALSTLGVIKLFSNLGIAASTARFIAEYKEADPSQVSPILRFSFLLNSLTIMLVCLALFFGHRFIADLIGESNLRPFLLLGIIFVIVSTLFTYVRRIFQGLEEITISSILQATNTGTRLIFGGSLVFFGYGAIGAFFGYILAYTVTIFIGLGHLYRRYYDSIKFNEMDNDIRRQIAKYSVPLTATNAANKLEHKIDTVLVGFFLGPVPVAYYTIGKQVTKFLETPVTALGFTLSPTYEAQKAKGNHDTAAQLYKEALAHSLLLYIPAAVGIIIIADQFVKIIFGEKYLGAVPVLQVLAIYIVLRSIMQITGNGLDYLGYAKKRAIAQVGTAILNFILNIILIPSIGVIGAAIATVISYAIYTIYNIFIIMREFDIHVWWLFRHILQILLITIVMAFFVHGTSNFISGFITMIGVISLGVLIWGTLSIILGLFDVKKILLILSK